MNIFRKLKYRLSSFLKPSAYRLKPSSGFTLVELLVSVGIFSVITTMAVFNNAQFNASVLLTNLAYEVAISIRQAQFYGIVVKQTSADSTKFDSGYGIYFDLATPAVYKLFEDKTPQNHLCDVGECTTPVETFNIQKGNSVSKVCVTRLGVTDCAQTLIHLTFLRPNPDAYIRIGSDAATKYEKAEVCLVSPRGTKRKVVVESTGQISVSADTAVCN